MSLPEDPSRPADVVLRSQRPGEQALVRDILTRSFARPEVADLAESLQDGRAANLALSIVAEVGGELVGQVQLSWSWLDAAERLVDVLVLSPLGVVPEHQRRGLGGLLVNRAVEEAGRLGAPALFLEGSPDYYSRFGFERASGHGFTAPSVRIPDVAFQVVLLPSWQPWMSGALVYAEAFWAFDCVGLRPSSGE